MIRYPEKNYLIKYDLNTDLFNEIEEEVLDVIPLRKVFILNTKNGRKILKRLEYSKEKIEFVNWCTKSLNDRCKYIIKFKQYADGSCYKIWNNDFYVLMDLIAGREVTFTNPIELKKAVELSAYMHKCGNDILNDLNSTDNKKVSTLLDKSLIEKYTQNINDIELIYNNICKYKYKNEFDKIFADNAEDIISEMKKAKELLINSSYNDLRKQLDKLTICHNDLAEHNFLINENNEVNIIDFDYASIDLKIMDVADILLKSIKNVAYDISKSNDVLNDYNLKNKLSDEEKYLIYVLLLYPRDSSNLIINYYYKKKNWEEDVFLNRLKNKIANDVYRREFLSEYKKKIEN